MYARSSPLYVVDIIRDETPDMLVDYTRLRIIADSIAIMDMDQVTAPDGV